MNKDVIYIEPEDDITDIITKLENSKEKIVALVPPKKASVLRSIVNIKLIIKAAAGAEKTVVLVTTDPSIVKLAAATRIPVTKNLQSAPAVPDADDIDTGDTVSKEDVKEKSEDADTDEAETKPDDEDVKEDDNKEDDGAEVDKKDQKDKKKKKRAAGTSKNPVVRWFQEHKKLAIFCGIGGVVLILVLIWALVIAPAATITVNVRTVTNNFSENISFTDKFADENAAEGKFYLEEKKIETKNEVAFEATGMKNVGEKATGEIMVYAYFQGKGSIKINAGTIFTISELAYVSDSDVIVSWDGYSLNDCGNYNPESSDPIPSMCRRVVEKVSVTAKEPGTKYNIAASDTGWKASVANIEAFSEKAMSGGTDKNITIVQQSDIDAALEKLKTPENSNNKEKLLESLGEDSFAIESSFKRVVGEAVSKPALGEEVKSGEKATLSVTTTDKIYVVDGTKVKDFITEKAKLAENYKIYSMNDPFIENFTSTEGGYIGKLKTAYVSGPKIAENDVVDIVRGKGLGVAQHDLKDAYDGISSITIDPSFPWVSSIPNDANKITVFINVDEKK